MLAAAFLMAVACGLHEDAEFIEIHELACVVDDTLNVVPAQGGSMKFRIYSNGNVTISAKDVMPEWASLSATEVANDSTVTVTMTANTGFERVVELVAVLEDGIKQCEFSVRQEGSAYIFSDNPYAVVKGSSASEAAFMVDTNIPDDKITVGVTYPSGTGDWVTSTEFKDKVLKVQTKQSSDASPRKAMLKVNLVGAADSCAVNFYLTQASSADAMGAEMSFADLRSKASLDGTVMEPFVLLRGVVISDYRSANMELNPVLSLDEAGDMTNTNVTNTTRTSVEQVVDTSATQRTAYIQAVDGSLGFKLVFDKAVDNVLAFGSMITIDLGGTVLTREDDPERYVISGVTGTNILESEEGTVVEKLRKITELTDSDIFTFVSVPGVEFPVKEGSYTDVRDNNALYSEVNANTTTKTAQHYFFMDGYATTLVDAEGNMICCPINMLCRWRRPAEGIPQGSGTAKGIITYNEITRYGDAGRYQLRVVDETGFENLNNGGSNWTVIAQWDKAVKDTKYTKASYGSDRATLTCEKTGATIVDEHSYKSIVSATKKTDGISDEYRSIRVNSSIKDWYEWDEDEVIGYRGMLFSLSTADLTGENMLFAFRFYAGRVGEKDTYKAFPSHWCVEYSLDGETWAYAQNGDLSGNEYVHLRAISTMNFTLNGYIYRPSTHYTLGPTGHAFVLPSEAFGVEKLQIRLRPYDNVMSSLYSNSFRDDLEHAVVTSATQVTDYVSFQDIIISYR